MYLEAADILVGLFLPDKHLGKLYKHRCQGPIVIKERILFFCAFHQYHKEGIIAIEDYTMFLSLICFLV